MQVQGFKIALYFLYKDGKINVDYERIVNSWLNLNNDLINSQSNIIIYTTDDGQVRIEVRLEDEKEKYPDYFDNGKLKNFSNDFIVKAPNGENNTEVMERARDFINTVNLNENTTIGIFSHGRFLCCFIALLMNLQEEYTLKLKIPNTVPIVLSGNRIGNFVMESPTLKDLIK